MGNILILQLISIYLLILAWLCPIGVEQTQLRNLSKQDVT